MSSSVTSTASSTRSWETARQLSPAKGPARLGVDRGAVAACRGDLLRACGGPHDDQRVDALERGGVRERLGVVAGRDRDHAPRLLLGRERGELVQHPARLEGARALEALGFEIDGAAGLLGELARAERRRAVQAARDRLARRVDVVDREDGVASGGGHAVMLLGASQRTRCAKYQAWPSGSEAEKRRSPCGASLSSDRSTAPAARARACSASTSST